MSTAPIWIGAATGNYHAGRSGFQPEAIVIHIAEGSRAAVDSWFHNPAAKVSAHYLVCKDGSVHQYVHEADTAYHAGRIDHPSWAQLKTNADGSHPNPNLYTIGIEHEGFGNDDWTEAMYRASAQLLGEIAARHHVPLDRAHVVGHHEIFAPKTCPGSKVDLLYLIDLASGVR